MASKEWRDSHKEQIRAYRKAHLAEQRVYQRTYREKHQDRVLAYQRSPRGQLVRAQYKLRQCRARKIELVKQLEAALLEGQQWTQPNER